jgi:ATP-binding cassette subfamily B protein
VPAATPKKLNRFLEDSSYIRHYLWKYRRFVGIGLLSLVIVDLLELLPPIFLKNAVDITVAHKPRVLLLYFALAYVATALAQGVCRYGWRMYLMRSSMLSGRDLRGGFVGHLFGLSASFFDRRRIGDLMSLATNDVDAIRMSIGAGVLTLADAFFYIMTVPVMMIALSPKLALLAFLPLPLIPWFVIRNERELHSRFERVQGSFSKLAAMAQENLNGIRVVKAFAREDRQMDRFREAGEEYIRLNLHLARVEAAFGPMLDFMMSMGLVILLFFGGKMAMVGAVSLGTFVAFQRYIQKIVWPMTAIGIAITHYQRAVASSGRIKEIFAISSDTPQAPEPVLRGPRAVRGEIEYRDLRFRFSGSEKTVLDGISLRVEPGMRVAFVGSIGSGKSALLQVIPRMYPVTDGMLFVDGVDVNHWPIEELRKQIGYVSQEVFLFSESVSENIAFGLAEWSRDPAHLFPSTQMAAVHDDVLALVQGYETRVGERGLNLSGGQKQRLTLARALVREPAILILDDALSSVDVRTEERILRALRSRQNKNTELISAHRISTVREADRIVVLESGKVVQQGRHFELIRQKNTPYFRFHEQQRLKEELESFVEKIEVPDTEART